MNDHKFSKFTCKESGGYNLVVTHGWSILVDAKSEKWQEWGTA
jgi:hypothetical protein